MPGVCVQAVFPKNNVMSRTCRYEVTNNKLCYIIIVIIIFTTVNPERIASVIFNDFIIPATLTSLYDNECIMCFTCVCA